MKGTRGTVPLAVVAEAFAGLGDYHEQYGRRVCLMQGQKQDLVLRSNDVVRLESPKGEELAVLKSSESKLAGLGTVTATVEGHELSKGAGLLKVEKAEDRPSAWGAVYAQYRLPLSEVAVPLRVFASAKKWTMNIPVWATA